MEHTSANARKISSQRQEQEQLVYTLWPSTLTRFHSPKAASLTTALCATADVSLLLLRESGCISQ